MGSSPRHDNAMITLYQDYAESTLPSELDDYQTSSEFDLKDIDNSESLLPQFFLA